MLSYLVCALAAVLTVVSAHRHTYYLPGVAPKTFKAGEAVSPSTSEVLLKPTF